MPSFGTKNKDLTDGNWLKGIPDGVTLLQICEPTPEWVMYYEHFDAQAGEKGMFAACARKEMGDCEACNNPDEKVSKAGAKWALNAINKDGRYGLYKVGAKIKKAMELREQTKGLDITTKMWEVTRSGKGLETEYMTEAAGPAEFGIDPSKFTDAGTVVAKTYFDYLKAIADEPEPDVVPDEPVSESAADAERQDVADRVREQEADKAVEPPAKTGEDFTSDPEDWGTEKLREYVTQTAKAKGEEAPGNRTARSKLVALAKRYQGEPPF